MAQDAPLPADRYIVTRDVDFFGADRTALFDTSEAACKRACSADEACVGYTFNSRSNACFPKAAIRERQPYVGAISAVRIVTPAAAQRRAADAAARLTFLTDADIAAARDLADGIGARFAAGGRDLDAVVAAAMQRLGGGDILRGLGLVGTALALSDRGDLWALYAETSLRFTAQAERRRYGPQALPAAINAYLRAAGPAAEAAALERMAQALVRDGRGRDSIPALRLAVDTQPRADLSAALDDAIGKYGFRVVGDQVDSDSAAPRLCAEFSEQLAKAGVDYAPFVRLDAAGYAVVPEGTSLCIEGLAHGQRYNVTFRTGLPSASGDTLVRDVTLRAYMRDRSPAVRFPGRTFVLPRTADAAIPVDSVNVTDVALRLRRVSDRNLLRALQDGYFGRPLSTWQDRTFATELAQEVWTGTAEVAQILNRDVKTRLPLGEVLAAQPTGIYALSAAVPGADPYDDPAATQWFVLTDIGLATWAGTDGLTVAARSLASAAALEGAELQLISRANVVLGTARTGADGYARFPAGLTRGEGGAAPPLLVARHGAAPGAEDIAFLPLTDPAFDLSDRGVEGRAPAGPIDTFLATDRGAY
ncbi:MAG: PAN domain-containing protein, partial [Pseudomonadota bacterium]